MISRKNKLRYRHLQDTLTGELAMLEGKMGNEGEEESEYKDQLERLRKELELN